MTFHARAFIFSWFFSLISSPKDGPCGRSRAYFPFSSLKDKRAAASAAKSSDEIWKGKLKPPAAAGDLNRLDKLLEREKASVAGEASGLGARRVATGDQRAEGEEEEARVEEEQDEEFEDDDYLQVRGYSS